MPTYLAFRTIGEMSQEEIEAAIANSREVREQLSVRLIRSYHSAEAGKLYCEYEAPNLEIVLEFNRRVGIPVDRATVVQNLEPSMFR